MYNQLKGLLNNSPFNFCIETIFFKKPAYLSAH
jgi:hypothetical protein